MKKKIAVALIAGLVTLFNSSTLQAQLKVGSAGSDVITVNSTSTPVLQLFLLDSITPQQSSIHLASFEMEIGSNESKQILAALLSERMLNEFVINTSASERTYSSITVKEIIFPELNARATDALRVKVTLQAEGATVRNASGKPGFASKNLSNATALRSNFRLLMGGLPSARVSRISAFNLEKSGPVWFSIDISHEQDLYMWRDWFFSQKEKTRRTEGGTISLLDRALTNSLLTLQLSDVEIVSLSTAPPTRDGFTTTTIGLRASGILMGK